MKTIPKTIINNPAVEDCDLDDNGITDEGTGELVTRYDVLLKEGYSFHDLDSVGERRQGLFRTVKEFLKAEPKKDLLKQLL